ncbi:hypothetical protein [Mycobacterium sp.]|jgi:hypothetical protein|uniref:hypothetical protein n=1 Tax=Mycobacterium sp. TaxID=1785 RepID=UPI002D53C751|nr:hypothetical protein [Mycobacterium sp.]HZA11865.1 hypothetical protein [Mycobacterium sp.]
MRIGLKYIAPVLAAGAAALAIAAAPTAGADPGRVQSATIASAPAVDADYHGGDHGGDHGGYGGGYRGDYRGYYHGGYGGWFPWGGHR